jgi:hypothetical protein
LTPRRYNRALDRDLREQPTVGDDWQMPRRGEACEACQRSFEPAEPIQAYLYDTPEGYQRRDYCAACRPDDEASAIGTWRTRRPPAATKKTPSFDREAVYGFFEQLEDAQSPEKLQLRFVMALLLWRKKVLKFDGSDSRDGGEIWRFTTAGSGDKHVVERPELAENELERLGEQLEGLLTGEFDDPSALALDSCEEQVDE